MQDKNPSDTRLQAWHSARTFALLAFVTSTVALIGWHARGAMMTWQWGLATAVTGILLLTVLVFRKMPSRACAAVFLATAAAVFIASSMSNQRLAEASVNFEGFAAYKLGAIGVALIAPFPIWVGYVVIAACGIIPYVQYYLLSDELRHAFAAQEPWYTLVYAIIGLFILRHRLKAFALERTITRISAEKKALDDLAGIFLALRDLTNTPLQSIELTAVLLENEKVSQRDGAKHLGRALIRLRSLSRVLAAYQQDVDWTRARASFDAIVTLQKKLDEMNNSDPSVDP